MRTLASLICICSMIYVACGYAPVEQVGWIIQAHRMPFLGRGFLIERRSRDARSNFKKCSSDNKLICKLKSHQGASGVDWSGRWDGCFMGNTRHPTRCWWAALRGWIWLQVWKTHPNGFLLLRHTVFTSLIHLCRMSSEDALNLKAQGKSFVFTDGGAARHNLTIHNAVLTSLKPATRYYYHCGDPNMGSSSLCSLLSSLSPSHWSSWPHPTGWSSVYHFTTLAEGKPEVELAVYGDMGVINSRVLASLQQEV